MQEKRPAVYIMTNQKNGTLYVGVTSDLVRRAYQHKSGETGGFAGRYGLKMLVYYEAHDDMASAILREKQLKRWKRPWKLRIIRQMNPNWRDLYADII